VRSATATLGSAWLQCLSSPGRRENCRSCSHRGQRGVPYSTALPPAWVWGHRVSRVLSNILQQGKWPVGMEAGRMTWISVSTTPFPATVGQNL